jgi:hypothetical protein
MMKQVQFANLIAVEWDRESDKVFLKFEVFDSKYKDFALRVAGREDISLNFIGEKLEAEMPEEGQ